jgi:hypothetical protein
MCVAQRETAGEEEAISRGIDRLVRSLTAHLWRCDAADATLPAVKRRAAIRALGHLGKMENQSLLLRIAQEGDPLLAREAEEALKSLREQARAPDGRDES